MNGRAIASNLLLLLGIPLLIGGVLFGLETGQPLFFFLWAPILFVRWLIRRERTKMPLYADRRPPDRPDLYDSHHTASIDDHHGSPR